MFLSSGTVCVLVRSMEHKILIASTNEDHRFLLTAILKKCGFAVDAPTDLSLCSKLVEENDYHKVVLDYDYKSVTSRLFCSYLDSHQKFNKSVVIQALTDDDLAYKVFEQGGRILSKPYDTEDLVYAVMQ